MALYYNNKRVLLTDTRKKHHYSFGARTDYNSYKILGRRKISTLVYNNTTLPQIVNFYYPGKQKVSTEETIIPIYFTDWYQREYFYDDDSLDFNIRLDIDGVISYIKNVKAGDYDLSLGVLSTGEHDFSIEIEDIKHRVKSQRLFNKIWIVDDSNDIKESETHQITLDDLSNYNITLDLDENATSEQLTNNRHGLTSLFNYYHEQGYRKLVLPENSYIRINMQYADETQVDMYNKIIPKPVVIPTNTTIDLNASTIKLHPYDDRDYSDIAEFGKVYNVMIAFKDCIDSHLINGIIEGDYFERKEINPTYGNDGLAGANGEHNGAIIIYGGRYNTLENITVKKVTGYNVMNERGTGHMNDGGLIGIGAHFWSDPQWVKLWKKGDETDLVEGKEVVCTNRVTSDYIDISVLLPYGGLSTGPQLSDYPTAHYHEYKISFFDENKTFITEFNGYQARTILIPEKSKYVRLTIFTPYSHNIGESCVLLEPFHPEYIEYNNCTFIDNRTCVAPNRFKHFRMYNCKFIRSGQSITPLAIDAEDGGSTMQDLFIENCEIVEPATRQTGDCIACAGLNIVFQNNTNLGCGIRGGVIGATIRNNKFRTGLEISTGWRTNNTIRCYDNDFNYQSFSPSAHKTYKSQVRIKNGSNIRYSNGWSEDSKDFLMFDSCTNPQVGCNNYYKNCSIYMDGFTNINEKNCRTGHCTFDNCTFSCYTDETSTMEMQSYNYGSYIENIGEFNNCEFNFKNSTFKIYPIMNGAFVKGKFNNCIFNSPTTLQFLYNNNMGDIQFNNCNFNCDLEIELGQNTYIEFNNCTFNNISYIGESESNCIFNN